MKIVEKDGKIRIGDLEFYGQIQHGSKCAACKANLIYYDAFDTYFCPKCNEWTEPKCSDPSCTYCPNRPDTPLNPDKVAR